MERLSEMWGNFSLSKSEGSKYQVRDEPVGEEHFIATRFFTGRAISIEAVARTWETIVRISALKSYYMMLCMT